MTEERDSYAVKEMNLFTALRQQASDTIRLEKKLDAILACLSCPRCEGTGQITEVDWTRNNPYYTTACYCRDAARAVLEE